jgi:site-specific recombinase XerD
MLNSLLDEFFAWHDYLGHSPGTIRSYGTALRAFFHFAGCDDPNDVTFKVTQEWDTLLAHRIGYSTRRCHRIALRSFFRWWHEKKGGQNLDIRSIRQVMSDPNLLHPDDFLKILYAQVPETPGEQTPIQRRDAAIVTFLACTGVRPSEAIEVCMSDVRLSADAKNFVVTVITRKRGVSGDRHHVTRIINFGDLFITGDIASTHFGLWFVKRYLDLGGSTHTRAQRAPLFASELNPMQHISAEGLKLCIQRACARTKLTHLKSVTPLTFRHFFGTQCHANGMDIRVIQGYMGHSSIQTTSKYIHLLDRYTGKQAREQGPTSGLMAKKSLTIPAESIRGVLEQCIPHDSPTPKPIPNSPKMARDSAGTRQQ